jgi:transposase
MSDREVDAATVDAAGDVRLRRPDRSQGRINFQCLDECLAEDHPARIIWQITGKLDLTSFHQNIKARSGSAGRDATDPRLLVALWLYAATDGVGSARELARLCESHDAYRWLCGGVSVNYHTLSDFRVSHERALDELLTQIVASLVDQGLVKVQRISQDGTKVRVGAGAGSFKGRSRLEELLKQSRQHVEDLKKQSQAEAGGELSKRRQAARQRAAREREQRIQAALKQLPVLEAIKQKKNGKPSRQMPKASITDAEARRMKMPDGGVRPAVNVQLASDTASRIIVGVAVSNAGTDHGQAGPMRQQVQDRAASARSPATVGEHLVDGGYVKLEEVEAAASEGVRLYMPVPTPRKADESERYRPQPHDSEAVAAWRVRMGMDGAQEIYQQRAATSETVNADLKVHRGLGQVLVRGLNKIRCVVLWSALAYNLMHCAAALLN